MYNCNADLPKVTCEDKNSQCGSWANRGECQKNPRYMRPYCQKSCGLCDDFTCRDYNHKCDWASWGECKRNPAYMLPNCPKSCGLCKTGTFFSLFCTTQRAIKFKKVEEKIREIK